MLKKFKCLDEKVLWKQKMLKFPQKSFRSLFYKARKSLLDVKIFSSRHLLFSKPTLDTADTANCKKDKQNFLLPTCKNKTTLKYYFINL